MNDLEITKLCAEAMSIKIRPYIEYDPLHDDAQAMALMKKFRLFIYGHLPFWVVISSQPTHEKMTDVIMVDCEDVNYAICRCVAKMQKAKNAADSHTA